MKRPEIRFVVDFVHDFPCGFPYYSGRSTHDPDEISIVQDEAGEAFTLRTPRAPLDNLEALSAAWLMYLRFIDLLHGVSFDESLLEGQEPLVVDAYQWAVQEISDLGLAGVAKAAFERRWVIKRNPDRTNPDQIGLAYRSDIDTFCLCPADMSSDSLAELSSRWLTFYRFVSLIGGFRYEMDSDSYEEATITEAMKLAWVTWEFESR